MINNHYKDDFIEMWTENGILYHVYPNGLEITLPVARHITQNRIKISGGKSWPLLTDARRLKSIDKEAREFWAKDEGLQYLTAGVVLINSPILKLLGNAFIFIDKPAKPLKLFTNQEAALKWLEHYKRVN
jgi:hypothetical protein